MQGGINTKIDAINKAIVENNHGAFSTHLNELFKQSPIPNLIVQQWIEWIRALINQGNYPLMQSALHCSRAHSQLREPLQQLFDTAPELEDALIDNFKDDETVNTIEYLSSDSKTFLKILNKWYEKEDLYALSRCTHQFSSIGIPGWNSRTILKNALRDKKLDIAGTILKFRAHQDNLKGILDDYDILELIDTAIKDHQFSFVFGLMTVEGLSEWVMPDDLDRIKEKIFKESGQKTKNSIVNWPDGLFLDASLVIDLCKKEDWENLSLAIMRPSIFISNSEVFLDKEFNAFTKILMTRYGREAVPLIEQLERGYQPWRDLLPAEAYILENQKDLYEKIKAYHLIPKDTEADLLHRLKALWDIEQIAKKWISTGKLSKEQSSVLNDIVSTCQNKAKYIGKLKKMDRKLTNRLFRLEHREGQPLRVEGPQFPALGWTFNSEVLTDLDPFHRDIPEPLFEKWLQDVSNGKSKSNFWLWLENQPDVDLKINEYYRMPKEILRSEFDVATGKMQKTLADGKKGMVPDGSYLYNIDRNGNLYIATTQFAMHHSHLIKDAVLCAGMIKFKDGLIMDIDNNSGHYMPSPSHLKGALKHLNLPKDAFSSEVVVSAYDDRLSGKMVVLGNIKEGNIKEFLAKANEAQERKDLLFKGPAKKNRSYDDLIFDICDNFPEVVHASFVGKISEIDQHKPGSTTGELCRALPKNTHLKSLTLTGNILDEQYFPKFLEALQKNNSLKKLDVSDMSLTENQCALLKTTCEQKNIKLQLPSSTKKISPE